MKDLFRQFRFFLKDTIRQKIDFSMTDQNKGLPPPPVEKPYPTDSTFIDLPKREDWVTISNISLVEAIKNRKSHRHYKDTPLSLEELSFLLWATQGIRLITKNGIAFRTVPSAGCRHSFETYLCVLNVEELKRGLYRYLPLEHKLLLLSLNDNISREIIEATFNQTFTGRGAVTFIWTTIPYRMEWRYHLASHKVIAIDVGHVCQNLYLACSVVSCGACAVGAYHQEMVDKLIGVDGENEFTIYLAAVGKI
ncbi:MAG: SagB/ThcOx family dehydrogenase [Thermodesulfovibrionales bacterium]|nr:SagB/ThcOx family dehydrogenase [Thermodesulfovibrionales bacterium]